MRIAVEPDHAYRLLNHGATTLVTAAASGAQNVMAAAWVMPLDVVPPRIAAVIASDTCTRTLVDASQAFVVNVPTVAMLDVVHGVGSTSGRDLDKFAAFGIRTSSASRLEAPFVEGCVAWLECRVRSEPSIEKGYDLFVADVLAAWADDHVFRGGAWHFDDPMRRSLHHVTGGEFFALGEPVRSTAAEAKPTPSLERYRAEIDALDAHLVALLAARTKVVDRLFEWKAECGSSRIDPDRERELLERRNELARRLGAPASLVEAVFAAVLADARRPRER
jgi:flavin reductase (DIM6/NTAB) family NADH-FMN oxidoreductase RutF/chorismate mutase